MKQSRFVYVYLKGDNNIALVRRRIMLNVFPVTPNSQKIKSNAKFHCAKVRYDCMFKSRS